MTAAERIDACVIVCAYTEARWNDLEASIASVHRQTVTPREIVIVIDHNPVMLERAKSAFPEVRVIANRWPQGVSGAKNTAVEQTQGSLIVFLDDDAVAEPCWLARIVAAYADPRVVAVGGLTRPSWPPGGRPAWFPAEFDWVVGCSHAGLPEHTAAVRNLIGANMSVRREIFEKVGGFRVEVGRLGANAFGDEDTEFCVQAVRLRQGGIVLHVPEALIHQSLPPHRASLRYFCRRCFAEGLGKAQLVGILGARDALSSERHYVAHILPRAIARGVIDSLRQHRLAGLARASAIVLGLGVTSIGYATGRCWRVASTRWRRFRPAPMPQEQGRA